MNVNIETNDNCFQITLDGKLDTTNVAEFEAQIKSVFEGDLPNITILCDKLTYISSIGLRIFLMLQKSVSARNGKLTIKNLLPEIKDIFDMTGFSSIFIIE